MTEQPMLFDVKDKPPKKRVVGNSHAKPVWTKYHAEKAKRPHRCDFCMRNMVDNPSAPAARLARFQRKTHDGLILYLCVPHTNDQRVEDGLQVVKR